MKTIYFEPTFKAPIMFGDTVTKVDITKVNEKKIKKIAKKYEDKKSNKDIALEEAREDLLFLLKEFNADDLSAERIRELRDEIRDAKKRLKKLEEETEQEREELAEEMNRELCLLASNGNKKTIEFFEKIAEENSWSDLSVVLKQAFEQYEKDFLGE